MQGSVPVDNLLKHGLNNLVILADFALVRVPVASYHFQVRPIGSMPVKESRATRYEGLLQKLALTAEVCVVQALPPCQ